MGSSTAVAEAAGLYGFLSEKWKLNREHFLSLVCFAHTLYREKIYRIFFGLFQVNTIKHE